MVQAETFAKSPQKSPKCLGGNLGDFWGDFAKVSYCLIEGLGNV